MYVAQKILKSMSSISAEVSEDNDDMDDLVTTFKSIPLSPTLSLTMSDRQLSLTPPADENFTVDPLSPTSSEPPTEMTNSKILIFTKNSSKGFCYPRYI